MDVGGTFTDLVALDVHSGESVSLKLSSTPHAPEVGVVAAVRALMARYAEPPDFQYIAHSTTIATNALLGQVRLELPRVAFITTHGFRDVIEIGRQNRSEVYNLFVRRPKPLIDREDRFTVRERIDHRGEVLLPLADAEIARVVEEIRARPVGAIAVGLLHSYANPEHERTIGTALQAAFPDMPVTLSCDVDPEYREFERFSTAVVNAALMPLVRGYIERLSRELQALGIRAPLYIMQSNGGMAGAHRVCVTPAAIIESGPASGVIAAAHLANGMAIERALSFDMGGTSAKAGTIASGTVQVASEFEAAGATHSGRASKGSGYPVRFPFVDLAEISAGGGTIAWIDDADALRVGPMSAGADPGPACYGCGGGATVTDANVVLGRLNQHALAGGTFPIDAAKSHHAIAQLAQRIGLSVEETAEGIVRIVDSQMAKVLRIVTIERGLDPRDFALIAFGGNGPLHACALAEELGITRIIVPAAPGVFSAQGLLVAPLRVTYLRPLLLEAAAAAQAEAIFQQLEESAKHSLRQQGAANGAISIERTFDARYAGQSFELEIASGGDPADVFHQAHQRRYGYNVPDEPVELVNARVAASATIAAPPNTAPRAHGTAQQSQRSVWIDGKRAPVVVQERESLRDDASVDGPALIEQFDTCTYVAAGWRAHVAGAELLLERT